MIGFGIDTAADTVTIDGVAYSVTSEADQAKIAMVNKLIDKLEQLRICING